MNLSPEWEEYLHSRGMVARHWSSVGAAKADDNEIIEYAVEQGFVVPTADLDFGVTVVKSGRRAPSVVQIRGKGTLPESIGTSVLTALRSEEENLLQGAVVTVDPKRTRLRRLPSLR